VERRAVRRAPEGRHTALVVGSTLPPCHNAQDSIQVDLTAIGQTWHRPARRKAEAVDVLQDTSRDGRSKPHCGRLSEQIVNGGNGSSLCGNANFSEGKRQAIRSIKLDTPNLRNLDITSTTKPLGASACFQLHGFYCSRYAKYVHDALQVVGQHVEAHFGTHSPERPGQEVCGTHPVLERAEDMFDRTSTDGHCIGLPVESSFRRFKYIFMLPSSDPAIVARAC
jgi:hypothetical protein